MKKRVLIGVLLFFILICIPFVVFVLYASLREYHEELIPKLIFTLPVEKCESLAPEGNEAWTLISWNQELYEMCQKRGHVYGEFFALKGCKAIRFIPERFNSIKGKLKIEEANPNIVYFYQYNRMYYQMLNE